MNKITLTRQEVINAAAIGVARQMVAIEKGLINKSGDSSIDGWGRNINGVCGEVAAAKFLNVYHHPTVGKTDKPDLTYNGIDIEVRTNRIPTGDLIIYRGNKENCTYLLVTGTGPTYNIRGWITGTGGKLAKYLRAPTNRPASYFVPQSDIKDIDLLTGDTPKAIIQPYQQFSIFK